MTPEQQAEELKRKIAQAKTLASLDGHPGWVIVKELLEAQVSDFRESLCQLGLDQAVTERMRGDIKVMRWCLRITELDTPEQFAEWEEALAKQEEKAKMIADRGLPPGGR